MWCRGEWGERQPKPYKEHSEGIFSSWAPGQVDWGLCQASISVQLFLLLNLASSPDLWQVFIPYKYLATWTSQSQLLEILIIEAHVLGNTLKIWFSMDIILDSIFFSSFTLQLTLEQHRFGLHGSTYMRIFSNKFVLEYYTVHGWLNWRMWNCGYRGLTVKLYTDFSTEQRVGAPNLCIVQESTVR